MTSNSRVNAVLIAGLALLAAAWGEGWVDIALEADRTHIVLVIAALAAFGMALALCGAKRAVAVIANVCVTLGFIGTIIGFVLMLSSVDADRAGDVTQVAGMIGDVIAGMGIALHTTLAGCIASLWLSLAVEVMPRG